VSVFSSLWGKLRDKAYREAFVVSQLKRGLPMQIRVMLKDRGWNQGDLAERSGLKQGVISRAADPDYGNLTINTILRIASGFDVAYVGRFVPFSDLARWYADLSEPALSVPGFSDDNGLVELKQSDATAAQQHSSRPRVAEVASWVSDTPAGNAYLRAWAEQFSEGMTLGEMAQPLAAATAAPTRIEPKTENSSAAGSVPSLVPRPFAPVISINHRRGTARHRKTTGFRSPGRRLRRA
jgi:transcriptional regulator with XRE-family HTH domain